MIDEPKIAAEIMAREGDDKFTNFAADRGGPTKFGITQKALSEYRGRPASVEDVRNLQRPEALAIYISRYIQPFRFASSNPDLMELLIDCGVNHGLENARRFLQRALGVKDDGDIGQKSLAALAAADRRDVYFDTAAQRVRFFGQILANDYKRLVAGGVIRPEHKSQFMFAGGWLNRAAEFVEEPV